MLCGANADFEQLASIARRAAVGASRRRFLRIRIPEQTGAMHRLLHALPETVNLDFQYGKIDDSPAYPVIGFDATRWPSRSCSKRSRTAASPSA